MAGKWKEVVKLSFKGERFRDHALDLQALSELSQLKQPRHCGEPRILTVNACRPILKRGFVCV
jgi:hypothetical protein